MPKADVIEKAFDYYPYRWNRPVKFHKEWVLGPAFIVREPNYEPAERPNIYLNFFPEDQRRVAELLLASIPKEPDPAIAVAKKGHERPGYKTPCKGRSLVVDGKDIPWELATPIWRLVTASYCDGFTWDPPILAGFLKGKLVVVVTAKERRGCYTY